MKADEKVIKIISNETKDAVNAMDVVTPTIYASIFEQYAKEHGQEIEDESQLAIDILKNECSNITTLHSEVSKNTSTLSSSTEKAISAIKSKDEALLNEVLSETQALKQEVEKLRAVVYTDTLTHTYNRKWLHDNYLEESTFKQSGTLVMIDLNYFKEINDTYGHIIGDKVLLFIASELKKTRNSVVRFGGDEFIVLFHERISLSGALKELIEVREKILAKKLKSSTGLFRVSFSFGGAEFKEGDTLNSIIELADKNMYEDKVNIKKRVTGIH